MLLEAVYDYLEDDGRPHVAVDASTSLGAFLVPVVALRGGNASLPLHLLEFLFARFLLLAPELTDTLHPDYRFGALAISPARFECAFGSLVSGVVRRWRRARRPGAAPFGHVCARAVGTGSR